MLVNQILLKQVNNLILLEKDIFQCDTNYIAKGNLLFILTLLMVYLFFF